MHAQGKKTSRKVFRRWDVVDVSTLIIGAVVGAGVGGLLVWLLGRRRGSG